MLVDYYKYVGYGFPNNLVEALTDALPANYKGNDTEGWEITVRGVYQMLKERLDDRERDVLLKHWRDGITLADIGKEYGVTGERIHQIERRAMHKLTHTPYLIRFAYIPYTTYEKMLKRLAEAVEGNDVVVKKELLINEKHIDCLQLSVRPYNCLIRNGYRTVGDVLEMDRETFFGIRNLGSRSADEIIRKIHAIGCFMSWE